MTHLKTPKLALWLLRRCSSPRYREALVGDVIEMRESGRSYFWCWRQALSAMSTRILGTLRYASWFTALKALILVFGMITLGMGTLVWAEALGTDAPRQHAVAIP